MNLDYLKTYLELVRLGSFSEVAKKLSLSQPAVSFQVRRLERELGVPLVDRRQRTLTLTAAGKRLLTFAEAVMQESQRLRDDIDRLREDIAGDLRISASTIPGEFLLPRRLADFKALHPAIRAQVAISDSMTVIRKVQDGAFDIGFCGLKPAGEELESFPVGGDEIVLIVFPEHPFASRDDVAIEELEGESFIFREETSGTQRSLDMLLSRAGVDVPHLAPTLVLGSTQAVISAVEAGLGIAFVSNLAIKKSLALRLVNQVTLKGLELRRDFYCVYRKSSLVSRLVQEFVAFIRTETAGFEKYGKR